ncbi:MAG: reverse transcriptase-like protein [Candidatus Kaiserbacteria bacterium]|nr:reverse transcriptase-like protein [Candidatus Kaiserbacteria bacterium]MCB9816606.1 reverse transcriptase-like protein [Candidatus Nomurabacteria bacterium]
MKRVEIFTRGLSKGNPGPAAIAAHITDETGAVMYELSEAIGNATDTYAEYFAVIKALQAAQELFPDQSDIIVELRLTDQSVKMQLNNEEVITNPGLVPFFIEIHNLRVAHFPRLIITHVRRKRNVAVDHLVNTLLDV